MLELNAWFFVLLVNFLALLYILNIILFKPLLTLFQKRDDSTRGALAAAKELSARKEEGLSQMNRELQAARTKSKELFEKIRNAALDRQKEVLDAANLQASDLIEKARQELKAEAEKARERLRGDVEKFSDEIVRKLVGA
ncbi:MAG TPA: ATP synthase F0 subunit B [Thermodesulfovibrionales bacterium]|nr:ATP synthase F0 subunit B [Thermodesulfovibrionales bacterium]